MRVDYRAGNPTDSAAGNNLPGTNKEVLVGSNNSSLAMGSSNGNQSPAQAMTLITLPFYLAMAVEAVLVADLRSLSLALLPTRGAKARMLPKRTALPWVGHLSVELLGTTILTSGISEQQLFFCRISR
mmetsp:Transcript_6787/g.12596  ORF Transcript_6787/g.12596 Transcript_6787/m.12596 type:complete len:128 (+) Transcript_6787:121-504(+)